MTTAPAPGRLGTMFAPRSVALVGASDHSGWSRNIYASLRAGGFDGVFVPVHPKRPTAFGLRTVRSLREMTEPVDLAFVLVPTGAVFDVLEDAGAAGVPNLIVLASGFGEVGAAGRELERRLVERANDLGVTLLGPNGIGFLNTAAKVMFLGSATLPGSIGLVLQSGAVASFTVSYARNHGIGLSFLISMGNEAMVTTADVIDHLIEDDGTRVIALFLEAIREPERFRALAEKARRAGKALVALKVGRSPAGREAALAHTGALAGNDAVVDGAFRQHGVIRVRSLEELLVTADLLSYAPPLRGSRAGVVTVSGGACDIVADRAHDEGIDLPAFAPSTLEAMRRVLPAFMEPRNPVDATGSGLAGDPRDSLATLFGAFEAAMHDPNIDFVLNLGLLVPQVPPADPAIAEAKMDEQARLIAASPVPVINCGMVDTELNDYMRGLLEPRGLRTLPGLELGMTALGHLVRWNDWRRSRSAREQKRDAAAGISIVHPSGTWNELEGRRLLDAAGVPLVPAELATTSMQAVTAAERLGYPVALKVCASGIPHKTDVGGVALHLGSGGDVRSAFDRILRTSVTVPDAHVEGVLVTPMRTGGLELLAGVTRDDTFGPVLAVGLGGVWAEALQDVALRVLPIDAQDVYAMLSELRGAALLGKFRGQPAIDKERLVAALLGLCNAASHLGDALRALEVNPLWCHGDRIEALDVLVETGEG